MFNYFKEKSVLIISGTVLLVLILLLSFHFIDKKEEIVGESIILEHEKDKEIVSFITMLKVTTC